MSGQAWVFLGVLVTALVTLAGTIATYRAKLKDSRSKETTAEITANVNLAGIDLERDKFAFESLHALVVSLNQRIEAVEASERRQTERADKLEERVKILEDERRRMLTWMAMNQLEWPPPQALKDSL